MKSILLQQNKIQAILPLMNKLHPAKSKWIFYSKLYLCLTWRQTHPFGSMVCLILMSIVSANVCIYQSNWSSFDIFLVTTSRSHIKKSWQSLFCLISKIPQDLSITSVGLCPSRKIKLTTQVLFLKAHTERKINSRFLMSMAYTYLE